MSILPFFSVWNDMDILTVYTSWVKICQKSKNKGRLECNLYLELSSLLTNTNLDSLLISADLGPYLTNVKLLLSWFLTIIFYYHIFKFFMLLIKTRRLRYLRFLQIVPPFTNNSIIIWTVNRGILFGLAANRRVNE
jgi:hypothetical protein